MTEPRDPDPPVMERFIQLLSTQQLSDAAPTAERIFEALRVRLSSVLGAAGYSTLLARSFALTRAAHPWLAEIPVDKTGSLTGQLEAVTQDRDFAEAARGLVAVLTRFTSLLTTFIGADLTNRLLEAAWQELESGSSDKRPGENYL